MAWPWTSVSGLNSLLQAIFGISQNSCNLAWVVQDIHISNCTRFALACTRIGDGNDIIRCSRLQVEQWRHIEGGGSLEVQISLGILPVWTRHCPTPMWPVGCNSVFLLDRMSANRVVIRPCLTQEAKNTSSTESTPMDTFAGWCRSSVTNLSGWPGFFCSV